MRESSFLFCLELCSLPALTALRFLAWVLSAKIGGHLARSLVMAFVCRKRRNKFVSRRKQPFESREQIGFDLRATKVVVEKQINERTSNRKRVRERESKQIQPYFFIAFHSKKRTRIDRRQLKRESKWEPAAFVTFEKLILQGKATLDSSNSNNIEITIENWGNITKQFEMSTGCSLLVGGSKFAREQILESKWVLGMFVSRMSL